MLFWEIFLYTVAGIFSLLLILLITKITLIIDYENDLCIYLKIFPIKIRLNKQPKPKRHKVKSLKAFLEKNNKQSVQSKKDSTASKAELQSVQDSSTVSDTSDDSNNQPLGNKTKQSLLDKIKSKISLIKQKIKKLSDSHKSISNKIDHIYELIKVFIPDFSKYLRIRVNRLEVCASCEDAKDTALQYALYHTAVSQLFAISDSVRVFKINHKKTYLTCDYLSNRSRFGTNISVSLYVWQILKCTLKPLFKHLQLQRKEVQNNG